MTVINRQPQVCICAQSIGGEPKPDCPHCFGTGRKVIVREIYGVVQESNGASTMRKGADYTITKEIFVDAKYIVNTDDLIIYDKQVFKAYQIKTFRLQNNDSIYFIVYGTPLKYDSTYIIDALTDVGVI